MTNKIFLIVVVGLLLVGLTTFVLTNLMVPEMEMITKEIPATIIYG